MEPKESSGMDISEAELYEIAKTMDEMCDYSTRFKKNFYILKERQEGKEERIKIKNLEEFLPVDEIRRNKPGNITRKAVFVEVEGTYYPDFLEEKGIYFLSVGLAQYIKRKLMLGDIVFNRVAFVSEEGKRVEEYCLIVPEELDCILDGSQIYGNMGELQCFEIDDNKTGELDVFKVKGFPHIIVTQKLNRIDFAGYECTRIENYFDYEGWRDRKYKERLNGGKKEEALRNFERIAEQSGNRDYIYDIQRLCIGDKIRKEVENGIKNILDSYNGKRFEEELISDRFLMLFWSLDEAVIELAESQQEYFEVHRFEVEGMKEAKKYIDNMPRELKTAGKAVCLETILYYAGVGGRIFDRYGQLHEDMRFRIYLHEKEFKSMNPHMIYDFKSRFQKEVEGSKDLNLIDLSGKDLREYDFSGKDLSRVRIEGSNLRRARFNNSILDTAEFKNCDLTGTEFIKSSMRDTRFIDNEMDRTEFDCSNMKYAEIQGSDLFQCSFAGTDLTGAKIKNQDLFGTYFYRTKLTDALFEISLTIDDSIFRLSDLRGAKFIGNKRAKASSILSGGDFRNAEMSGCKFEVSRVSKTGFIKSKLVNADFSGCEIIKKCNFRWSLCSGMNMEGIEVYNSDFSYVDLSRMRIMKGVIFSGNDFTYTNISGYDFTARGYMLSNKLVYTNLSGCNMNMADFRSSILIYPDLTGTKLINACFTEQQLEYMVLSLLQKSDIKPGDQVKGKEGRK